MSRYLGCNIWGANSEQSGDKLILSNKGDLQSYHEVWGMEATFQGFGLALVEHQTLC